jgi:hypothetical protein
MMVGMYVLESLCIDLLSIYLFTQCKNILLIPFSARDVINFVTILKPVPRRGFPVEEVYVSHFLRKHLERASL